MYAFTTTTLCYIYFIFHKFCIIIRRYIFSKRLHTQHEKYCNSEKGGGAMAFAQILLCVFVCRWFLCNCHNLQQILTSERHLIKMHAAWNARNDPFFSIFYYCFMCGDTVRDETEFFKRECNAGIRFHWKKKKNFLK